MPPATDLLSVPPDRAAAARRIADVLRPARVVALSTHINADGDGCGSEAALARLLAGAGHTVRIVNPTPWPSAFAFLLGDDIVDRSADGERALEGIDALVVLDIGDVKRLGTLSDAVRALAVPKLVIDHHVPGDEPPGPVALIDIGACATGELVFDVARTLGWPLTPAIATALYVALMTIDPEEMYRRVYASVTLGRLQLLRDALDTLTVDAEHALAWISVPAGVVERYALRSEDLDGLVEHPRSIAGTRMALFFRDLGHGKVKVSFRSTGDVDVNVFARTFAGGGHAKAAGALIAGSLDDVRTRVVEAARRFLDAGPAPVPAAAHAYVDNGVATP
jgi:phosphoesterase RecJ-like protein